MLNSTINQNKERGQLLIEFLVALGVMAILLTSGLEVLGPSLKVIERGRESAQVSSLIRENFEIVRSLRNEDWNVLSVNYTYHYIDTDEEEGGLSLENDAIYFGKYLVGIIIEDVYRDESGNILETGTIDQIDVRTKKVSVSVDWNSYGIEKNETQSIYLTNWGGF